MMYKCLFGRNYVEIFKSRTKSCYYVYKYRRFHEKCISKLVGESNANFNSK